MTTPRDPRARNLGLPLQGDPGPNNAITDVPGVEVGYTTLIDDIEEAGSTTAVRTGVTAILPRGKSGVGIPSAAATFSLNGNGEMTGSVWLEEAGSLASPILITNTHSVGAAHEGVIRWIVDHSDVTGVQWLLPVVAETWDGILNDINGFHVRPEHAVAALETAAPGPVAEGSVGGGTGMICYGFKGGSGTSSRRVIIGGQEYTVGVFLQANFGERRELTVTGVPVGPAFPEEESASAAVGVPEGAGSVIVVVGTDAPLLPGQCKALARRVSLGLARTGTSSSHFSGDIFLAFSTANEGAFRSDFPEPGEGGGTKHLDTINALPWGRIDPLYEAVVQATEEAVLNVLVAGQTMSGHRGRIVPGLPVEQVLTMIAATRG